MKSIIELFVTKLSISDAGTVVAVDTQVLTNLTDEKSEGFYNLPRGYCNFVMTYDEYIRMKLKVGDSIRIDIFKVR